MCRKNWSRYHRFIITHHTILFTNFLAVKLRLLIILESIGHTSIVVKNEFNRKFTSLLAIIRQINYIITRPRA